MSGASHTSNVIFYPLVDAVLADTKPKHHTFSLRLIALSIALYSQVGLGRRTVVKVLELIHRYVLDTPKLPGPSAVRNWALKLGKQLLSPPPASPIRQRSGSWCLIADISIKVGSQRLLLLLGVDLTSYDFAQPLTFADIEVLGLVVKRRKSWTAECIVEILRQRILPHSQIDYMVCDGGPNLRSAAQRLGLVCIDDIGHAVGRALKRHYSARPDFEAFIEKCVHLRRYNTINSDSHLRPPKLRGTARFMNLSGLVEWGYKLLAVLDGKTGPRHKKKIFTDQHRAKVAWLEDYRPMITKLHRTMKVLDNILRALKAEGLSEQTVDWALKRLGSNDTTAGLHSGVYRQIKSYLKTQLCQCRALNKEAVICSTDIIESCFGKYKYRAGKQTNTTYLCAEIASYGIEKIDYGLVKRAMEGTRLCELKKWHDEQLCYLASNKAKQSA